MKGRVSSLLEVAPGLIRSSRAGEHLPQRAPFGHEQGRDRLASSDRDQSRSAVFQHHIDTPQTLAAG